jgi:DNA-binding CsgD family transcriptional regulator
MDFVRASAALAQVGSLEEATAFTHQVYWLAQMYCAEEFLDRTLWRKAVAALLVRNADVPRLFASQLLHSIAETAIRFAENAEAERSIDEALAIDREHGFVRALAYASAVKATIVGLLGRLSEARQLIETALTEPDMYVVRIVLAVGASPVVLGLADETLAARCLDAEAIRSIGNGGFGGTFNTALGMHALHLYGLGRTDEAREVLARAVDGEQVSFGAVTFWPLAARFLDEARLERLRASCAERSVNPDDSVAQACGALLDAAAARRFGIRDGERLGTLAAERYRALGWPLLEALAWEYAGRNDAALAIYRAHGSVADLRRLESRVPSAGGRAARSLLSAREREVADLVARGMSNRAIAQELGIGEKTIEKYITAIFAKLQFSTRAQLAAHVARSEAGG